VATLALQNICKVFDNGVEAVKDLNLFIDDGEFVVLVGPSGCGKTTVLRMVAGLEDATSGTISLDGRNANDLAPGDRDIAMVFQNYALYPHLTVRDNIAFSLAVRKVPKKERGVKVEEAARLLGLTELLDAKPRQLSGGQRQRVAMGRALVREPAVFLMDEPLSNLDAALRAQMRTEVMHIQKRLGVATMYVTHDQTEAMTMGDRVAVMRGGVLQQFAAPQELYDHPGNVFVASFMGSPAMNLFHAAIETSAEGVEIVVGSQRLLLNDDASRRLAFEGLGGKDVIVGIRPEELIPESDRHHSESVHTCELSAEVELIEALGNEQLVHFTVDAENHREPGAVVTTAEGEPGPEASLSAASAGKGVARVDPRLKLAPGQRIDFAIDAERIHFFDPDTGHALTSTPAPSVVRG
jgi:multiple sugar transport system ATP-binding protein